EGPLPYQYGMNLTNGTPIYRRAPLRRERVTYEKGLPVGRDAHVDRSGLEGETPWWLQDHKGQKPQVSLEETKCDNCLVEQRMVRGSYLALDRAVNAFAGKFWRTPHGKLVPYDHILVHKPKIEFEGAWVGKEAETRKVPMAWVLGLHARQYKVTDDGKVHRF